MIRIGLTGSIGMGKSTTAGFFAEAGVPVNDADQVVHDLYRGEAVPLLDKAFPGSVTNGVVDRSALSAILAQNPARFRELESIVHPLVQQREIRFLAEQKAAGHRLVLLDIPLLFESGAEKRVDVIVVVSCAPEIQRARVLARPGMTPEKFEMILARQLPDSEKRKRADFVVDTGSGLAEARRQVLEIIAKLQARESDEGN